MAGKSVTINGVTYRTIGGAREHFRTILNSYKPGTRLSTAHFAEVNGLFTEHDEYATRTHGKTVVAIEVLKATGGTQCFYTVYDDGSKEDFSCQNTIVHAANKLPAFA